MYSAGSNQNGQLGLGHCKNTESFQRLGPVFEHVTIKMLSAGCNTSAALTGWNFLGCLIDKSTVSVCAHTQNHACCLISTLCVCL